jgi:anion transporter
MAVTSSEPGALKSPGQPQLAHSDPRKGVLMYWLLFGGLLIGASLFVIPAPTGVNPDGWHVLGLLIPIVVIWATEAIPVGVASLVFLALVVAFHYVTIDVAFKGFTNHLPWLMLGAFGISAAMERSGLSKRMTYFLLSHLKGFWGLVFAAYAANTCLMAVPSSAARSGILAPVLSAIMTTIGRPTKSNLSRSLTYNFCNATNAFVGDMFLTGGAGNAVMLVLYTTLTGKSLTWIQWLVIMFLPSLIYTFVAVIGSVMFGRPEPELVEKLRNSKAAQEAYQSLGPMTADEWKVLGAFLLAVFLWIIGGTIKLDPGLAAVIVMGLLFLPKIGVLPSKALRELNWDITLLIGTAVGVAGILDQTGMIKVISGALISPLLDPLSHFGLIGIAVGCIIVGLIAHFLLPAPSNLTLAVPLLITWGTSSMHLPTAVVLAFLGILSVLNDKLVMLAYQMPPYYVYLAMDVTDGPRFNALLIKLYPVLALALIVCAFVAYGMIMFTGFGA